MGTVDLPPLLYAYGDFDCALNLRIGDLDAVLVSDCDGRLCPIGFNSKGLGISVFNLHLSVTSGFDKPGVSIQSIVWELLLGQYTLKSAIEFLESLPSIMCGGALVLADSSGVVTCEVFPGGAVEMGKPAKCVVRANHPIYPKCAGVYGE